MQARLAAFGYQTRIEVIKTTGDKITDVPLAKVGSKGVFTKEIEEALLSGEVDVAVHSMKDLPTELPAGLTIAAIPDREDARDAMVGASLEDLPRGARVGTGSLRRAAQLRALRADLQIEPVRGNLDTRVRKLDEGQYHAVVLAAAGLKRLGWAFRLRDVLAPEIMCPAPGQGALAIETRADDGPGFQACSRLDHGSARAAVTAERAVLAALGGGCQVPIGAYAHTASGELDLLAIVISPDGGRLARATSRGNIADSSAIGTELGRTLLEQGARDILDEVYATPARDDAI